MIRCNGMEGVAPLVVASILKLEKRGANSTRCNLQHKILRVL